MTQVFLVFFGGGLGSVARYLTGLAAAALLGVSFPWGTLSVNIAGGFIMGVFAGYLSAKVHFPWASDARLFLMTGILGGFTTFSAFSLDAVGLWQRDLQLSAVIYVLASVFGAIAAVLLGLFVARTIA